MNGVARRAENQKGKKKNYEKHEVRGIREQLMFPQKPLEAVSVRPSRALLFRRGQPYLTKEREKKRNTAANSAALSTSNLNQLPQTCPVAAIGHAYSTEFTFGYLFGIIIIIIRLFSIILSASLSYKNNTRCRPSRVLELRSNYLVFREKDTLLTHKSDQQRFELSQKWHLSAVPSSTTIAEGSAP